MNYSGYEISQKSCSETSTDLLQGFYLLNHALAYIANTRSEVWQGREYLEAYDVIEPLRRQISKPFRSAGILKEVEDIQLEGAEPDDERARR
jgi:hypothetical protein